MRTLWLFCACCVAASAGTVDYDVVADWSPASNPNGAWEYLWGAAVLPPQTGGVWGAAQVFAPGNVAGNFLPAFWEGLNAGGVGEVYTHAWDPSNGQPGPATNSLVWTSANDGVISVAGSIEYTQFGLGRSDDYFLYLGATLLTSGAISETSPGPVPFSFSDLPVTAGETLALEIQRTAGFTGTIAGVEMTVDAGYAPEPSMIVLTGLGLLCLCGALKLRTHWSRSTSQA